MSLAGRDLHTEAVALCGLEFTSLRGEAVTAAPADSLQAAQLLRLYDDRKIPVCVEGSGSKGRWMAEGPCGLRLSTQRMNAVLEHTWQDMTCTVQAGCTWSDMQAALAQHGQFVALDPLWPERATVGGIVAANDSGALRLHYGGLRDLLIGMTVVLADGTLARSGGKVVKNVAGYDLPKMLCGSFGTLALITEVTFRLHSIAPHTINLTATSKDPSLLGRLLLRVLDSHFSTQSMQMRTGSDGYTLDVRLAASPDVLRTQADGLVGVAGSMGVPAKVEETDAWFAREKLFSAEDSSFVFKATMLPVEIAQMMEAVASMHGSAVTQANGIMFGSVPRESEKELKSLRAMLEAAGGSLILLHDPSHASDDTERYPALDRWGALPQALPLMRAVKQQFDPNGILNPGRFLGGL